MRSASKVKEQIKGYCAGLGIDCCGIAPSPTGRGCAIVCLFPYYQPIKEVHNLSRYAVIKDYHQIVMQYLMHISQFIQSLIGENYEFHCFCDNSPYHDRQLAVAAGLGVIGQNTCLIHSVYGSYIFIGYIICETLYLPWDTPQTNTCLNCGRCRQACCGGALQQDTFILEQCASHISQKKGDLSAEEEEILKRNPLIWGCDICQDVCPHNQSVPTTPIPEFHQDLIPSLSMPDILPLSGRAFKKRYHDRAFSWRGRDVLLRNLTLKEKKQI